MDSSLWAFLPLVLLIVIVVATFYVLRRREKHEEPGPQGQSPYGVHGWLAFYIGASYYLAPLFSLGRLNGDLSSAEAVSPMLATLAGWGNYKAGSWLLVLIAIAVQWRAAWLLKHRWAPSSVLCAKIVSVSLPIVLIAGDAMLSAITLGVNDAPSSVQGLIKGLFTGLCWLAYFQFSKRVRNTYYSGETGKPVPPNNLPQGTEADAPTSFAALAPKAEAPVLPPQPARPLEGFKPLTGSITQTAIEDTPVPLKSRVDLASVREAAPVAADDALWGAALAELEGGRRHAATWARSFAVADGDEAKAKAAYLRERVRQMHEDATTVRHAAEAEQRAVITEAENRVAAATKRFVEGSHITEDEIATLVNASEKNDSLTRMTDRIRGNTLLHLCARHGLYEAALALLRNGSSPDAGNGNGQKPVDLAAPDTPLALALQTA